MALYRVSGDEGGETHLAEIELPEIEVNSEGVEKLRGVLNIPAISVGIVELTQLTPSQDLHPAPERRLLVFLRGETEIITTSGDRQVLRATACWPTTLIARVTTPVTSAPSRGPWLQSGFPGTGSSLTFEDRSLPHWFAPPGRSLVHHPRNGAPTCHLGSLHQVAHWCTIQEMVHQPATLVRSTRSLTAGRLWWPT
jgi:hypothetical protein